jgi:hypothetical protein
MPIVREHKRKMDSTTFNALPLHDARIADVVVDWEQKQCRFQLSVFTRPGSSAKPYTLTFEGVTLFVMSHEQPWGSSLFVNSVSSSNGHFKVEMQSGDIIEIRATTCVFSAL